MPRLAEPVGVGGVHVHATLSVCGAADPVAVKVNVPFWQAMPEIDTCCGVPGESVPFAGLNEAFTSLLADQPIVPVELASSVSVTVQGPDSPHVLPSRLAGLTDHAGGMSVGEGDGDGINVGDGEGDGMSVGEGDGMSVGEGDGEGDGMSVGEGVGVMPITTSVTATCAFPPFELIAR